MRGGSTRLAHCWSTTERWAPLHAPPGWSSHEEQAQLLSEGAGSAVWGRTGPLHIAIIPHRGRFHGRGSGHPRLEGAGTGEVEQPVLPALYPSEPRRSGWRGGGDGRITSLKPVHYTHTEPLQFGQPLITLGTTPTGPSLS